MCETAQTLPGKLAAEISRVTRLRAEYEEVGRLLGGRGNTRPAMLMMQISINKAILAAGSPDIEDQIAALKDLEDYT